MSSMTTRSELSPDWDTMPQRHELVGALNTEAKAVLYLAVAQCEFGTPFRHVSRTLAEAGAFNIEGGTDRFNIHSTARSIGGVLIDASLLDSPEDVEPKEHLPEVIKLPSQRTDAATALAGLLLEHSLTHVFPLRHLLGERVSAEGQPHYNVDPIEARLAVLESLTQLHADSDSLDFPKKEVHRLVTERAPVGKYAIADHVKRLINFGLLIETDTRRQRIRFGRPLDTGSEPAALTIDLLDRLNGVVSQDTRFTVGGLDFANKIMQNPTQVAILVRRSFLSSKHTGKHTPHN